MDHRSISFWKIRLSSQVTAQSGKAIKHFEWRKGFCNYSHGIAWAVLYAILCCTDKNGLKAAVSGLHRTSLCSDADHHHCVCLESGYAVRYMLDFSWEAALGTFWKWEMKCGSVDGLCDVPLMLFVGLGCMACWNIPGSKSSRHVSSCFCRIGRVSGGFLFEMVSVDFWFHAFHDIINASEKSL